MDSDQPLGPRCSSSYSSMGSCTAGPSHPHCLSCHHHIPSSAGIRVGSELPEWMLLSFFQDSSLLLLELFSFGRCTLQVDDLIWHCDYIHAGECVGVMLKYHETLFAHVFNLRRTYWQVKSVSAPCSLCWYSWSQWPVIVEHAGMLAIIYYVSPFDWYVNLLLVKKNTWELILWKN